MSGREAVVDPWVEDSTGDGTGLRVATAGIDRVTILVAALTGLAGAVFFVALDAVGSAWLPIGPMYGILVAAVVGRRAVDPGRGLIWAGAVSVLVWLAVAGTTVVDVLGISLSEAVLSQSFFMLFIGLGIPTGVTIGLWHARRDAAEREPIDYDRAVVVGGLSGLVGGLVFSFWMARVGFFPLIAGIVGQTSPSIGILIHFVIAVTIGVTYGFLFQRDTRGFGSSLTWGMAYGFVWWVLGGLTIYQLLLGNPVGWTAEATRGYNFLGFLVGHIVYGLFLGVVYAVLDRSWLVLFYESDPLNYDVDGASMRTLQSMGWGLLASVPGVVLFGIVLWRAGELGRIGLIVGVDVAVVGACLHLLIGLLVGTSYGRLFRYESPTLGAGIVWGVIYGQIWWFLGPVTLLPVLVGEPLAWDAVVLGDALPWLVGHYIYGAVTGAGFYFLEQRRKAWAQVNARIAAHERRRQRYVGTAAPAAWVIVFGIAVVLVSLLL